MFRVAVLLLISDMSMKNNLKLKPIGIGSLPHNNAEDAFCVVEKDFSQIPFFPQLANLSRNEDMMVQFLEGLPSFSVDNASQFVLDSENENFLVGLEKFFNDYEEIIADINSPLLEKYAITEKSSSTFKKFENFIENNKPSYAKGQIVGAFTLCTSLKDQNGRAVIYDDTLRDIIVKLLSLKALWQIKRIKAANKETTPIIFMDEPSVSQIGSSAYITVSVQEVINMIDEISKIIRNNGGLSAIHCCGKCDWRIPVKANADIINFDAYNYSQNFVVYHREISKFLNNGGKIAWGFVPTSDGEILKNLSVDILEDKFKNCVKYLTDNGINEKLIIDNSIITSSCGAGGLSVNDAQKAMDLVKELSDRLIERNKF